LSDYTDKLTTARDAALDLLIELRTAHKPTYTVNGQTVSWTEYARLLAQEVKDFNTMIDEAANSKSRLRFTARGLADA